MRNRRTGAPWITFMTAVALGLLGTPLFGAAWEGLQLESELPIDTTQAESEVLVDLAASGFTFRPVVVTIDDKPKKAKKVVTLDFKIKNFTDDDYFVYATVTLMDGDGKPISMKSKKDKIEEDDPEDIKLRFKLSYADVERLASAKVRFAFEED